MRRAFRFAFFGAAFLVGCNDNKAALFTRLSPAHSGITFENAIQESAEINILGYEYTYNGGGVAAADFNNDGWCDLYFTGNMVENRLYINQGDLRFKDITEKANVAGRSLWKTGVTAADVNADGWMDLYVCYSGPDAHQSLSNQLFINNHCDVGGEPTFTERAQEYGLDAAGTFSTQASFFDYDRDGDLDMFLINHGDHFYSPFINTRQLREARHPQFGNRLYRNDANGDSVTVAHFTDVSVEAGIHGGGLNFSLGVSVSDVNGDGWPDIYVTNDYEEQDFLYVNDQHGKFSECVKNAFGHISRNGMGTDIADFNNDSRPDLMEVDMWPEDNFRQKLLKGPDDYNRYALMVDSGYHHQQMRNTLQLNAGISPDGLPVFCEIGQLAGVSATDWSWAPLFADLDNDGLKDIFVSNGYLRDFTSMDFLKYTFEEARQQAREQGKELKLYDLISKMASTKTSDYVFRNKGDLTFSDNTREWGLSEPNLSFGTTYADLDNDGDLELITNNTNEVSTVWLNQSREMGSNNYLRIQLKGPPINPAGIGARVVVESGSMVQMLEQFPTRGYQSSVDPILHVGLGNTNTVGKIRVIWPDGKHSIMTNVNSNQLIEVLYSTATIVEGKKESVPNVLFQDVTKDSKINFVHHENKFVDFDREPLLPYQLSRLGPALAKGDVNGDGFDDFYIGGAAGQSGELYLGDGQAHFSLAKGQPWREDAEQEDTGAIFFDAEGDGDVDLFVVSGGTEFSRGSNLLDDRLYVNLGKGEFVKAPAGSTVADHANGSCVTVGDYDKDGDLDLYVGGRSLPGSFPLAAPGAILKNESNRVTHEIKFTLATKEVNPDLREPGMITDALWTDYNNDSWPDLLLVGDWMPIRLYENRNGKLVEVQNPSLSNTWGLWNRISSFDFDGDGDSDYILGNAGGNLPWKISETQPLTLYYPDVGNDGRVDPIICYSKQGKQYPVASRDELLSQLPSLRKKFTSYALYGNATIEDILGKEQMAGTPEGKVQTVQTSILENMGGGKFNLVPLPVLAQISSVTGIATDDFNEDGFVDILLAGNFYPNRTQYGRSDAGLGLLMLGNGKGKFDPVQWEASGFFAPGDVRNMQMLRGMANQKFIAIARNNDRMSLFAFKKSRTMK